MIHLTNINHGTPIMFKYCLHLMLVNTVCVHNSEELFFLITDIFPSVASFINLDYVESDSLDIPDVDYAQTNNTLPSSVFLSLILTQRQRILFYEKENIFSVTRKL